MKLLLFQRAYFAVRHESTQAPDITGLFLVQSLEKVNPEKVVWICGLPCLENCKGLLENQQKLFNVLFSVKELSCGKTIK